MITLQQRSGQNADTAQAICDYLLHNLDSVYLVALTQGHADEVLRKLPRCYLDRVRVVLTGRADQ